MLVASAAVALPRAEAAISWDAGGTSQWWFDPENWSESQAGRLPPTSDADNDPNTTNDISLTDTHISIGTTGLLGGEGIVYDPSPDTQDPFFATAAGRVYPDGYGPQKIGLLYMSRNVSFQNLLTIKGDLEVADTAIIGRSGSGTTPELQNLGRINQVDGLVKMSGGNVDLGNREPSGWGNGTYDYRGGSLEILTPDGLGGSLRLSHGGSSGTGGHGRFIMHNPAMGGHVRAYNVSLASNVGPDSNNQYPDGINTGVAIMEYHFENGGTRPFQVVNNLSINNGLDSGQLGTRSVRLELALDEAPLLDGGVPPNLALFDIGNSLLGTGDLDGDFSFTDDRVFSNADATVNYREGDTVSATFGNTLYNWTISYTGNITYAAGQMDDSVIESITGMGTGTDIVLMGLSSMTGLCTLAGDFSCNGSVENADLTLLLNNWAQPASPVPNGWTGIPQPTDPAIDNDELTALLNGWGMTLGSGSGSASAVPEPSTMLLVLASVLGTMAGRRSRRSLAT